MRQTLELPQIHFGDKRLDDRFLKLVDDLAKTPAASLPEAARDWASPKAAYRFFDNPKVDPDLIQDSLLCDALDHLPPDGPILAVQDTTSLDFTGHRATTELGYLAHAKRRGLFLHSVLAVSAEGVPCGVLDRRTWTRNPAELGKTAARHSKPTAQKESQRWIEALKATEAALPADRTIVTIADREADIYDLFAHPRRPGSELLIRIKPQRGVRQPERLLGKAVRSTPVQGTLTVDVRRGDDRPPRQAVLTVRFAKLDVTPPVHRAKEALPDVSLTAILVEEENPPAGQEALRWWLITTMEVDTLADARRMVRWYTLRWLVERYHYVLKSGCHVERLQLQTAARLDRALATYAAVAWRLLWLTYEARQHPDQSCQRAFTPQEHVVLRQVAKVEAAEDLTLRAAVRAIAKLGGFLARKGDGEPGVKTIWRGLRRLNDMAEGFTMFQQLICSRSVGNA